MKMSRLRLLVIGLFIHVYVLVAWFCAINSSIHVGDGSTPVPYYFIVLISVSAVMALAVVLYVTWVRVVTQDRMLRMYLISPVIVTLMTALRLSVRHHVSAMNW